jgi:hypothetical protein
MGSWDGGFGAGFLLYASFVVTLVLVLIFHYVPQFGHSNVMVYIAICSLMGSLSVLSSSLGFQIFFGSLVTSESHEIMLIECKGSLVKSKSQDERAE